MNLKQQMEYYKLEKSREVAFVSKKAAEPYPEEMKIIEEEGHIPEQIFNFSETCLCWKKMPEKMYVWAGEKLVLRFKAATDHMTVELGSV